MERIGVLGAGSFGTALAVTFAGAGRDVVLWARRDEFAAELEQRRRNEKYLPQAEFPQSLRVTGSLKELAGAEVFFLAVPSHGFRETLRGLLPFLQNKPQRWLISVAKGIETGSLCRMTEVTEEECKAAGVAGHIGVLSGPNFAVELAAGMPSLAVLASGELELAVELQARLSTPTYRLYASNDVIGVELAGATKNVVAIAAGVLHGLGFGHNTLAALLTRGLHEISRLGVAYGGLPGTFSGLAGLGDLALTCTGGLSRNRRTGILLAEGKTLDEITHQTSTVAEGVRSGPAIAQLAKNKDVEVPIIEQMVAVMDGRSEPRQALGELMSRDLKAEFEM